MTRSMASRLAWVPTLLLVGITMAIAGGCSTAPKQMDEATVAADGRTTVSWFRSNVTGLGAQIDSSAGYVSFPGIGQYGLLIGGGKFGRGVVYDGSDRQVGWAYINTVSAGLQLGVQGFKMLLVFEDEATMKRFREDKLTGNVSATIVAVEAGGSGTASFTDGVAVYQGGNTGLLAGASVGLDYIRYEAAVGGT